MKLAALVFGAVATWIAFADGVSAAPLKAMVFQMQFGWKPYDPATRVPSGAIDADGIVHLRGAMKQTDSSQPALAFTLPPALRPNKNVYVTADMYNGVKGRLHIEPDGSVYAFDGTENNAAARGFTSLEGIAYFKN